MKYNNLDFYYVRKMCWNCGEHFDLEIHKGTTIDDYIERNKCPNCGCDMRLN